MVYQITHVTYPSGGSAILVGADKGGQVIAEPGRLGGNFLLLFPSYGYIKLTDKGNSVSGPGDWSVQVSGSQSGNWFYRGQGSAQVNIDGSGKYTITGGANDITGNLTPFTA